MIYDYQANFKVGQILYDRRNYEYTIIKITSNSLTLSNKHVVQMYSDNKLYYQYSDLNCNYKFIEYFLKQKDL